MILPSRKVLSVFILTAALVAALIIAFGRDKASTAINYASDLVAGEKVSIPENPDWQNELGNTAALAKRAGENSDASVPETTTDLVSRTFMENYLALEKSGKLDSASTQKLLDQTIKLMGQSENSNLSIPKLNIIPDNSNQTIADYGENLGNILKANRSDRKAGDEMVVLQNIMKSGSTEKTLKLREFIDSYEKVANEMAKMSVPKTFVKSHTDMVVGARAVALGLREMENVMNDPMQGLRGLQNYKDGGALFMQAMQATLGFIKQSGVAYKQNSGGYYLLYGI